MTSKQIVGLLMLVSGIIMISYGLYIQDSVEYQVASTFGGDTSRVMILMASGFIAALAGLTLLIFGGAQNNKTPNNATTPVDWQNPADKMDMSRLNEQKLNDIVKNNGFYRPDVVEASQRELLLRQKSEELLPQVREKNDVELREIADNPTLYTEELIRAAGIVLKERRRLWQEEQERAEQAARLEREKQAEERRLQRIVARKKRQPYVIMFIVIFAIAVAGIGYYMYIQAQQRMKEELLLAEYRFKVQQQQIEKERKERERQIEESRLAQEKQQQEEAVRKAKAMAEQQRKAEEQAQADRKRREAGYYKIGEFYDKNGIRGIVISTDETGLHGRILSLEADQLSFDDAMRKDSSLPSRADMFNICKDLEVINQGLKQAGATLIKRGQYWIHDQWTGDSGSIACFYIVDPEDSSHNGVSNSKKADIRSRPYIKNARWVYKY